LGKPIVNAGAPAPGMPSPEAQQLALEQEAALKSRLFATTAVQNHAPATQPVSRQSPPAPQNASAGLTSQDHKLAFLNGSVDRRTTSSDRIQPPASPYVLQAGSVIPASLISGLRSDLPGEVTAQVTEDVYDTPTGKILLIPQGARLLGQYDAQVAFGQTRALLVWTRLIMPNGTSIVLDRLPATDTQGYAGLEDQVDNHWGMVFKAAILSTILSVGSEAGISANNNGSLAVAIQQGMSQSVNQAGERVVSRSLNIQPTITIRPGFPVRVLVTRDLVLKPYRG
ncbi:MAG: TrbI/VirB10 family protein, partial [Bradyrhizobium sp.]